MTNVNHRSSDNGHQRWQKHNAATAATQAPQQEQRKGKHNKTYTDNHKHKHAHTYGHNGLTATTTWQLK